MKKYCLILLVVLLTSKLIAQNTLTDIDGNIYNTVVIGNQVWMKENLKTTHYRNGTSIPTGLSNAAWQSTSNGAFAVYNDSASLGSIYGNLYNWYAVADPAGLCPAEWHVPTNKDWNRLVLFYDANADTTCAYCPQSTFTGALMKEAGLTNWYAPNTAASNISGFKALPGGSKGYNGVYDFKGQFADFWSLNPYSPTEAYLRGVGYNYADYYSLFFSKNYGFSVRCVFDQSASTWTGLESNQGNLVTELYPNPTSGILHIETSKAIKKIEVFDVLGQLVLSYGNEKQIDLSKLNSGLYLIRFTSENGVEQRRVEVSR